MAPHDTHLLKLGVRGLNVSETEYKWHLQVHEISEVYQSKPLQIVCLWFLQKNECIQCVSAATKDSLTATNDKKRRFKVSTNIV